MKKEEVPQDKSALDNFTKEVCYALDDSGKYVTTLSTGWEVKTTALNMAWKDIEQRIQSVKEKVQRDQGRRADRLRERARAVPCAAQPERPRGLGSRASPRFCSSARSFRPRAYRN